MKTSSILLLSLLMASSAAAQQPNRVLVYNTAGQYTGYVTDRLDKVAFANVEGEVAAEITIDEVELDMLTLTIERSAACQGYYITVMPELTAAQLTSDLQMINYVKAVSPTVYYDDFYGGEMTGMELSYGSEYRVVTVGIDLYGVDCGVKSVKFATPEAPVQGAPDVTVNVTDRQLYSFTVDFTPNSDVSAYWCVAGKKGEMQEQYEQFGPMFGYTNFNEMIAAWGVAEAGPSTHTWTDMSPNTEYEIFVAMKDKNGNFAPYRVYETSTLEMGGDGEALVQIAPVKYEKADWNGEMLPSLYISFTPNDQASCYRFGVYTKDQYDQYGDETMFADLRQDPPMPMAYWFFYEPLVTDFQINPSTEIVMIGAAKNANGEWGNVTKVEYTTPSVCDGTQLLPPSTAVTQRKHAAQAGVKGKVPSLRKPGISLRAR